MIGRGVRLPAPIRIAIAAPILAIMVWAQFQAFIGKRSVDALMDAERGGSHPVERHARLERVPAETRHDQTAYYPSEHTEQDSPYGMWAWSALALGGTALSVLAGGFALFSLFGPTGEEDAVASGSEPFV